MLKLYPICSVTNFTSYCLSLFGIIFLILGQTPYLLAQEGTAQLRPNSGDVLYMEIYGDGSKFGSYAAEPRERIYIRLNAGEKMHFGMRMAPPRNIVHQGDPNRTTFRVRDPQGNIVINQTAFPQSGDVGFIDTYTEAVNVPLGVVVNGAAISTGFTPLVYTANSSGDHYIEFETWTDSTLSTPRQDKAWLEYFNVTVTDASNNLIATQDDPTQARGRLWSRQWSLTNTAFDRNPVNADFYVLTPGGFVNRVNFDMTPFGFIFVSNSFGVQNTNDPIINRRSQQGNALVNDISEHQIFLNDPDRIIYPSTPESAVIEIDLNGQTIFDYDQGRVPVQLDLGALNITVNRNDPSCPYEGLALFRVQSNIRALVQFLLDVDGNGFQVGSADRILLANIEPGVNFVPWDLLDGQGNPHPNGTFAARMTFLTGGLTHFPLFDVENLRGVTTRAIRPVDVANPTLFWNDVNLDDPPNSTLTIDPGSNVFQLDTSSNFQRSWTYTPPNSVINNGNRNTVNSWFASVELESDFQYSIQQSPECTNNDHDRDGILDPIDIDDDNDGIPDLVESPEGLDPSQDNDNDGLPNYRDPDIPGFVDSNNDGVHDIYDRDLDGVPDIFDLDSDNDGIMDVIEAGGSDPDGNGIIFGLTIDDLDKDGLDDRVDPEVFGALPGTPLAYPDTDGDGIPNGEDIDADSDGIPDNREGQTTPGYIPPLAPFVDSDRDGLNDAYDTFFNQYNETPPFGSFGDPILGGVVILPVNTDGSDEPDYIEQDSDNDNIPDWAEGFDDNEEGSTLDDLIRRAEAYETSQGSPGHYPTTDSDQNNVPDWVDDEDQDGIANYLDPDHPAFRDTDQDGLIDLYDEDQGGLGYGSGVGPFSEPDNDGDGAPNYRDIEDMPCFRRPVVSFNGPDNICFGQTITLMALETEAVSFTWRRDNILVSDSSTLTITNVKEADTLAQYTLEVDNGSCSQLSSPFRIQVNSLPNLDLAVSVQDPVVCQGSSTLVLIENSEADVVYQIRAQGDTLGSAFLGNGGNLFLPVTGLSNGTFTLEVLANKVGCLDTILNQTLMLEVSNEVALPTTFQGDTVLCEGQELVLVADAQGATSYIWRRDTTIISTLDTLIIDPISAADTLGAYTLSVSNGLCSQTSAPFHVDILDALPLLSIPIALEDSILCQNSTTDVLLGLSEQGVIYQVWLGSTAVSDTVQGNGGILRIPISNLPGGVHTLIVRATKGGCDENVLNQTLSITVRDTSPSVQARASAIEGVPGCTITLSATGADQYTWEPTLDIISQSPNGDEIIIQPQQSTTYIVTGSDAFGCTGQDSIRVEISSDAIQEIFIPSLFTPNQDRSNDIFIVHGTCIQEIDLRVFDRDGNLVYRAETIEQATRIGWDGRHNGKEQPAGKYLWTIEGSYTNGSPLKYQGRSQGMINLFR